MEINNDEQTMRLNEPSACSIENFMSHEQEQDFDPHYHYDNYHDNPVLTDMPTQDDFPKFTELQNFQTKRLENTGK